MNFKAVPAMLAMLPSLFRGIDLHDLERIKTIARKAYPAVPQLSTERLSRWLEESGPSSMLVVDVRSPEEFAVSHLRGAINLREVGQMIQVAQEQKPARTILYCSVGFRSSRLAQLMVEQGVENVFNLEGSIFQWANEHRPVYQGEKLVQQVHPYGRRWKGLLRPGVAGV